MELTFAISTFAKVFDTTPAPEVLTLRELTDALLYVSQRVIPTKLTSSGFSFEHPELEPALRAVLGELAAD